MLGVFDVRAAVEGFHEGHVLFSICTEPIMAAIDSYVPQIAATYRACGVSMILTLAACPWSMVQELGTK